MSENQLHPRNRHQAHYDFVRLMQDDARLTEFVIRNPHGQHSIDFADAAAVKALNRALLLSDYGIQDWELPAQHLCPAIPGRADYLHYLADLLSSCHLGRLPKAAGIRVLDIGTGASGVYPLLGATSYGWQFVASDINQTSLDNVQHILQANPKLAAQIELRRQTTPTAILQQIIGADDWFDLTMCNPPFHASAAEAAAGSARKWQQLGKNNALPAAGPRLNFGGQDAELWCPGGEVGFIQTMMNESATLRGQCFWFTTLVSKASNLAVLKATLKRLKVTEQREISMQQGQKQSRFLAWTFLTPEQQKAWKKWRW
ncbi:MULTISPECIES: 23S rRNA (adenine(1618)-N(6))-methyltransferase RlmF [unclassified Undibacterium]|uniref:23S rRNA (adenine(1618)-N(6))-methyltransferase RlmF n=1 Tax=unclassified Undibacterium TaxID=2630295 RepID=UPI002AC94121|nr:MULTISPECIES: 23S rRNA (adenine(1618)-N(6))-methyltransferase RlmF [unclassified Undibacterium]MEB0140746.1 23S rRNA (adenine(1618)-N(6))-methyltransferase RlmF [Undibacterium sp. CCC2.1]MEB0174222.1 23S rRNA (adenine(1618)-N(6))-methyltransferase RlmF [Undibacterium sp. CCC1.1]MEB0177369.1 23S rRNA (adenine(1618)-N(6))-methyltransferase RlmF [Undibacterium sp. CCC3.4]MEB0216938.1 23S rRNA (adenine(1618)-N(6))-methyltransferase RlmF [Undibacterium sp. 5I2]WPX44543.1 23S rRNA (adenine(1618)-